MTETAKSVEKQLVQTAEHLPRTKEFSGRLLDLHTQFTALQISGGRKRYAGRALARYAIEQIIQNYIEDDRVDVRPFIDDISKQVKRLVISSDKLDADFFDAIKKLLESAHDLSNQSTIPSLPIVVDMPTTWGDHVSIKGWLSKEKGVDLPISKTWYPFVPILEENILDPNLSPKLVEAFVREVRELVTEQKITCLGFIEKTMGPVGAILLGPILTKAVGLPAFVFREGYRTARSQIAGPFKPNSKDRVLLIYDLIVSGGGLKHAAEVLRQNFKAETNAAVVLFSYALHSRPKIEYFTKGAAPKRKLFRGTINVRPIARYADVKPMLEALRKRQAAPPQTSRTLTISNRRRTEPSPAKSGAFSVSPPIMGALAMSKQKLQWLNRIGKLIAIRFRTGKEVDRALDAIYQDPALQDLPWHSPDGFELHIPESAEPILRKHGLKYKVSSVNS